MEDNTPIGANGAGSWAVPFGYNCFGCAPNNVKGLHLVFEEHAQHVRTAVCLGHDYESFPGVIHGGIVALILDEAMARAVLAAHRCPALTVGVRVRYVRMMKTGRPYVVRAEVSAHDQAIIRVRGQLESKDAGIVAVAEGTFFLLTSNRLASGKLDLPDAARQQIAEFILRNNGYQTTGVSS